MQARGVVHCKREPYDVYIGRPSKWGNPYEIGKDGDRAAVIALHKSWLLTQPDLLADLPELDGKVLGCWCKHKLDIQCHGDTLADLVSKFGTAAWDGPVYVRGDATDPVGSGKKIICHVCNDIGAWGSGFVLALSRKWKAPEQEYRNWAHLREMVECKSGWIFGPPEEPCRKLHEANPFALGSVQFVPVSDDITVANMVAQHGVGKDEDGKPPIRYHAMKDCLATVAKRALAEGASVHGPKFGADRAGGDWSVIAGTVQQELSAKGVPVTVYLLPRKINGR